MRRGTPLDRRGRESSVEACFVKRTTLDLPAHQEVQRPHSVMLGSNPTSTGPKYDGPWGSAAQNTQTHMSTGTEVRWFQASAQDVTTTIGDGVPRRSTPR